MTRPNMTGKIRVSDEVCVDRIIELQRTFRALYEWTPSIASCCQEVGLDGLADDVEDWVYTLRRLLKDLGLDITMTEQDYATLRATARDDLAERYQRLDSAITPYLIGDLLGAARIAEETGRREFAQRLRDWAKRIEEALELERYDDSDVDADIDHDPGEHFMDDNGMPSERDLYDDNSPS